MVLQRLGLVERWLAGKKGGAQTLRGCSSKGARDARGGWGRFMAPLLAALLTGLSTAPARADIWGYIDEQGVAHFSALQLDARYELFFRGSQGFDVGQSLHPTRPRQGTGLAAAPPKLLAYFEVSPSYKAVKHLIRDASRTHGIDYELLQAVIATESGFNAKAVSPKGAIGLMQLIPPTAARYGVKDDQDSPAEEKLTDPKINIQAGSSYLNYLIRLFPGELELAIAAYNAGEGAVKRAGNKIPNYPETQNYVRTVMQLYQHLKPPPSLRGTSAAAAPVATLAARRGREGRVRVEMSRQGQLISSVPASYGP